MFFINYNQGTINKITAPDWVEAYPEPDSSSDSEEEDEEEEQEQVTLPPCE